MGDVLNAKAGGMRYAIAFDSIIYMEKEKRKITVHTMGEDITFYGRYSEILPGLDDRFVHPHCSYVVNMDHIFRLGRQEIVMILGYRIIIGQQSFNRMRKSYDAYIAKRLAKKGPL